MSAAVMARQIAAADDNFSDNIMRFYRQQRGGNIALPFPVFHGAEYQHGNGIGDIFRALGRFLMPIVAPTAAKFIGSTASALSEGKSLKESAKSALAPTVHEAIGKTVGQIQSRMAGSGGGRRRRRRQPSRNAKGSQSGMVGGGRKKRRSKKRRAITPQYRLYKGAKRSRASGSALRFLPTNF